MFVFKQLLTFFKRVVPFMMLSKGKAKAMTNLSTCITHDGCKMFIVHATGGIQVQRKYTWVKCYKTFYGRNFSNVRNRLECLSLSGFYSLI